MPARNMLHLLVFLAVTLRLGAAPMTTRSSDAPVRIGDESRIPPDPRQVWSRLVRFRPGDGQVVAVNPPRFSWPYLPQIGPVPRKRPATMRFTLQVSSQADFATLAAEIRDTDCNFANALPVLEGSRRWFWRVGYRDGEKPLVWSDVRQFVLDESAVPWDRSRMEAVLRDLPSHPRILFRGEAPRAVLRRVQADPMANEIVDHIIQVADRAIKADWYADFPQSDTGLLKANNSGYMDLARNLIYVGLAWLLTDDEAYAGFKERLLTMTSWPPGGRSSPEGMANTRKWPTHLTEYFGLFYDWFYLQLTPDERAMVKTCLEWRIRHTLLSYAWLDGGGESIRDRSIAIRGVSHPYENIMVTLPGALAIADESPVARRALSIGTNYIVGITSGFGEDEAWNEGPGYGNGKMKWLMDATCYLQTSCPDLDLGRNPMFSRYADFFARVTPLGARHCSFGNRGRNERDWCSSRVTTLRRVAMLSNDGKAMQNWQDTRRRLQEMDVTAPMPFSPWIDLVMTDRYALPAPALEEANAKLFPLEGWVTASSAPPSDLDAQKDAVSIAFHCRPRGGYSHSFRSENAFDIHAYGETVTSGGGTTSNQSWFANHTMSHNTILVNGREQVGSKQYDGSRCGRIVAYHSRPGLVYWAGDATAAYGEESGLRRAVRHVAFVHDAWFAIYDELDLVDEAEPGTFQWLYHIPQNVEVGIHQDAGRIRYAVGRIQVVLQHLAGLSDLTVENRQGAEGVVNPITGEDLSVMDKWAKGKKTLPKPLDIPHVWISHRRPRRTMRFFAVIVPFRENADAPTITALSDAAVEVTFGGRTTSISFGTETADIMVDTAAAAPVP